MLVKVNAMVPEPLRDKIRSAAIKYGVSVRRVVGIAIALGLSSMADMKLSEVTGIMEIEAKRTKVKQYERTKPFSS